MSASNAEVEEIGAQLLTLLGVRINNGSIVIHYAEGKAARVDLNTTPWKRRNEDRRSPLVNLRPGG